MDSEGRGKWVVGLNPDDRMPQDWLRMVARVFAAYRKQPLTESLSMYIDGFDVSVFSDTDPITTLNITSGQGFVDDQFIGFIEDSRFEINKNNLQENDSYSLVLSYQWVNAFPVQKPRYQIVKTTNVNSQQQLELATVVKTLVSGTTYELIINNLKKPWYIEYNNAAAGDSEVNTENQTPYTVTINSSEENPGIDYAGVSRLGTLDIGWALDFHHELGNGVDYNSRLHTDKINDGVLYINSRKILGEIDPYVSLNNDPSDPFTGFDGIREKDIRSNNNITVFDTVDDNIPGSSTPGSQSGLACYSLTTKHIHDDILALPDTVHAGKFYLDGNTNALGLQNRSIYNDPSSDINTFELTSDIDKVTINGHTVWHTGNLESTGKSIVFIGYQSGRPLFRPDGSTLGDGDMYYDTSDHTYWYWYMDTINAINKWVEVGPTESYKMYDYIVPAGGESQLNLGVNGYNPDFIQIAIDGSIISLAKGDYSTEPSGEIIDFPSVVPAGAVIQIMTVFKGQTPGLPLNHLDDVVVINPQSAEALMWNAGTESWENSPVVIQSLNDILDVAVAGAQPDDYLVMSSNGNGWVAGALPDGELINLSDVSIINLQPNDNLVYDGNVWSNQAPVIVNSIAAGTVAAFAGPVVPAGYLECDGSSLNKTLYSDLFDVLQSTYGSTATTFNIPDLRGEFIRGLDSGRGIDPGRVLGSSQLDEFKSHTHTLAYGTSFRSDVNVGNDTYMNVLPAGETSETGGSETRPRNIAMKYMIKY